MKTERTPQEKARDKWNEENKAKRKIYTAKSGCRRYIREFANLEDLKEVFGNREISISRELTKMFEEHIRGSIEEILAKDLTLKGEFVIVVDGYEEEELEIDIRAELERRVADGMKMSQAIKEVAKEFGLKKNDVYKVSLEDE